MNCIESIVDRIFEYLSNLSKKNPEEQYSSLLVYSIKLSYGFDFLYSSFTADPSEIFFSDEKRDDIDILNRCLTVVNPENLDKHLKKLEKAAKDIGFFMGIAQKGFQYKANTKKFMSLLYYSAFYVIYRQSGSNNGLLFQHTLDNETLSRMIQFPENTIVQRLFKLTLPKVELAKTFYIPISKIDLLGKDAYTNSNPPYIVQHRSGMNFHTCSSRYNQDDYVKVNLIANEDWGKVNWKKNR